MSDDTNVLVDAMRTDPDVARWPIYDQMLELHEQGLIPPRLWDLTNRLIREYEAEIQALKARPPS